ncbi:MAG: 16S rRNA (guanine(966)-N(2))-methyltransferase RsmD [Legionellaceae bacterium]|nr:16S rRNA (guanine(966)-N(2))-methyltransferase RsmD [Legionellaceae bacterium]
MKQSIRIIAGQYRGKKLTFPVVDGLRPTSDRIRETVFNWLMHDIRNACCLDAFSGSGALGFEAFSRGAAQVIMIEQNTKAFSNLKTISASFQSPKLSVIQADAEDYIKQQALLATQQFDLIFLDPPFAKPHLLNCIPVIGNTSLLKKGGLLYLESPEEVTLDPIIWKQLKLKRAGQVVYALYQKVP